MTTIETSALGPGGRRADWNPTLPIRWVLLDVDGTLVGPSGTVTDVVDGSFVVVVSAWKANSLIPIPRFCCWQTGARLETSCSEMLEALARRCPQLGALGIGFSAVSGVLPPIRFGAAMQHLDLSMVMQCAFRVDTLIKLRLLLSSVHAV